MQTIFKELLLLVKVLPPILRMAHNLKNSPNIVPFLVQLNEIVREYEKVLKTYCVDDLDVTFPKLFRKNQWIVSHLRFMSRIVFDNSENPFIPAKDDLRAFMARWGIQ